MTRRLDAAARGEGGVVLLSGEPGIGKSRLLREVSDKALSDGWLVLSGRAYDTEGMPPYLPFVEVLHQYVRVSSEDDLQPIADNAPEIARLVPEIVARFPADPSARPRSPESERYALFQGVSDVLLHAADSSEARGLLICLDDLHWADRSTLELFQHLTRKLSATRLCVVGTYRTIGVGREHPLLAILAELNRERLYDGFGLEALSPDETASLVALLTKRKELSPALLQVLYERTKGNPFFVEEVVRHLEADGRDLDDPDLVSRDWGTPEGVRQVIGRRLSHLRPAVRRLLQAAAVLGDEFSLVFPVIGRMLEVEVSTLVDTVDDAVRAGMLRDDGESYRFAHALIRDALLSGMTRPRQQSLHLRAAEAMADVYARDVEPHVSAIAVHYRLAGPFTNGDKAIGYSVQAGEGAEKAFAYEEAQLHWEAALELMERHGIEKAIRVRLVERLGELMQTVGFEKYPTSAAYFEEAITLYEKMGDSAGAAAMHARLGLLLGAGGAMNDNAAALRHLRASEPLLSVGPASDAQLSLYSGLGLVDVWQVHTEEGLAASTRAMEIALELGSEDRWVTNAVMRSYHLHALGRIGEGLSLMAEAWEAADRLNNTYRAFVAAQWLGGRLFELGDNVEARAWFQKEVDQPRQMHAARRQVLQRSIAEAYARSGELEISRRLVAEAGIRPGAELAFLQGRWGPVEAGWVQEKENAAGRLNRSNQALADGWLARFRRLAGDSAAAIELLTDSLAIGLEGPNLLIQLEASTELAIVLAESGRADESGTHLDRCRNILNAREEDWRGLAGRVALAEAVTAGMTGRIEEAELQMSGAVAIFRHLSLPWDEAEALTLGGCFYAHAGRRYSWAAVDSFDKAAAIYRARGAGQPWTEHVAALQRDALGGKDAVVTAIRPDHLSVREVEVLRLLAAGKSSKEIGEELVLSARTVERHITNIYTKTGTHGRVEAAAYALGHGLA